MTDTIIGRIFPGWVLEDAVTATVKTWIHTYLREIALQWERPILPIFRSYNVRPSGDSWPDNQLPAFIVVNAGLDGPPSRAGDGQIDASFRIGTVIVAKGKDERSARQNAEEYAAACRAILLHKHGLGIGASSVTWESESYDEGPSESTRTLAGAVVEFVVTVPSVVNNKRGPSVLAPPDPDTIPGRANPVVERVDLIVNYKRKGA